MPGQHAILAQETSLFWYGGMLIKVLPHHLLALGYFPNEIQASAMTIRELVSKLGHFCV